MPWVSRIKLGQRCVTQKQPLLADVELHLRDGLVPGAFDAQHHAVAFSQITQATHGQGGGHAGHAYVTPADAGGLAGAAAYTRSVRITGLGRGDKEREEVLEIRSLNNARGARGRKGKVADLGFKPLGVARIE